jgi:hypothetical protein
MEYPDASFLSCSRQACRTGLYVTRWNRLTPRFPLLWFGHLSTTGSRWNGQGSALS